MKLKVLVDNNTYIDEYYLGEPAVSYYIEDDSQKFLLDAGYSDAFLKNAAKMQIDLSHINSIIISHGHDDHTLGLKYYFDKIQNNNLSIIAHPNAFNYKVFDNLKICSPYSAEELKDKCIVKLSKTPLKISKNITFLGEIPSSNSFEQRKVIGKTVLNNKLQDDRILGIIGGFHLFNLDEQTMKTIEYFKNNNIKELYPCHCTSFTVRAEINKYIPVHEVGVGLEINW